MSISVEGIFETHIKVKDVEISSKFYQEVIGLKVALQIPNRDVIFLWIGEKKDSMIGLWGPNSKNSPISAGKSHFGFKVEITEFETILKELKNHNIEPLDFYGNPTEEPDVIGWVPNLSIYFKDPDNHSVEFIALLPESPNPEVGIVKYGIWKKQHNN